MSSIYPIHNNDLEVQNSEQFSHEDESALTRLSVDFKIKSNYLTKLFPGEEEVDGYKLPLTRIDGEDRIRIWPENKSYVGNPNKRI